MQAGQKPISLTPGAAAAAVCLQCLGHGPALTARCPQAESGIARNPAHHTSPVLAHSKRRLSLSVRRALRNHSCQSTGWAQVPNHWDLLRHRLCVNCKRGRHSERLRIASCSGLVCWRQPCMVNVTSPCSYYRKHIPSDNTENSSRSMEIRHLSETGTGWLRAPCCRGMNSTMCEEAAAAGSPAAHTDP